jgi:GT2 family glycosyltransferase
MHRQREGILIRPGVSIVVISHNEEKNIRDCLRSLTALIYPADRFEVIVVDSSSDRTRSIVKGFPQVSLLPSSEKGFSPKRNAGIGVAKNDFVAFVDADCMVPPDWLEIMTRKLSDQDVAAVACDVFPPPDASFWGKLTACLGRPWGGAIGLDSMVTRLERGINMVGTCHAIFRRSILEEVGAFDENRRYDFGGEDVDISQRIRKAGYVLEYETQTFIYHKCRDFIGFFSWSFRHGKATYMLSGKQGWKILLSPFSLVWPLLIILIILLLPFRIGLYVISVSFFLISVVLFFPRKFFPNGGKKLKLLIQRRKKIKISLASIYMFVIPLFYMDRFIINFAQMYCMVRRIG